MCVRSDNARVLYVASALSSVHAHMHMVVNMHELDLHIDAKTAPITFARLKMLLQISGYLDLHSRRRCYNN